MKLTLIALVASTALGFSEEPTKLGTNSSSASKTFQSEARSPGNVLSTIPTNQKASAKTAGKAATLPAARTITDVKGRTIEGTILSKTETAIKFRRASDNKEFEIQLDTLSDADKAFVAGIPTPQPIPLETENGDWFPHFGTYALFRVEDTIYAIYATGVDGERPDMKRTPGDDCYYSIQYSVTKITPGRPNQVITKAIDHEPAHKCGLLNFGKFKFGWLAGGHDCYRIVYGSAESNSLPPPDTEYYNLLLPTLDSIKELDPNRWLPIRPLK